MNGKGQASSADDCFAQFDEAFARIEGDLLQRAPRTASPPAADLSEYEEAFTHIDRQLAAHVAAEPAAPHVPQTAPPLAAPALEPAAVPPSVSVAGSPRPSVETSPEGEDLWRHTESSGAPLDRLVVTVQNLLWLHRAVQTGGARTGDRMQWEQFAVVFAEARRTCDEFDLPTARVRVDFAISALEDSRPHRLSVEIGELIRHIRHDLQSCAMSPIARSRAWLFNAALDERAALAFPSTHGDIAACGRAIGYGLHGAAVFHSVRAASAGRRRLAIAVQANSFEPAAVDWAATIAALESCLADALRWSGAAKTRAADFYQALLNDARMLLDADRKLHAGDAFDEHHAIAVLYATRHFLNRLAEYLSEADERPLAQADFASLTARP
jgi:hypothetical protein